MGQSRANHGKRPMHFTVQPKLLSKYSFLGIALLGFAYVLSSVAWLEFGADTQRGLRAALDLNHEQNLPTLFSTLQLSISAILLLLLARQSKLLARHETTHWKILSASFFYLMIDEFCSVHEYFGPVTLQLLDGARAIWGIAWTIPYSVLALTFAAFMAKFWFRLPRRSRTLTAVAASMFLLGALGMEGVGFLVSRQFGIDHWQFVLSVLIEESMEMSGIALLNYTCLDLLLSRQATWTVSALPPVAVATAADAETTELQRLVLSDREVEMLMDTAQAEHLRRGARI
jgi:hypothetical protein